MATKATRFPSTRYRHSPSRLTPTATSSVMSSMHRTSTELLASYARFTQRGVTLAGGQGVLRAGTVLGPEDVRTRSTTSTLRQARTARMSPLGILREDRDTSPGGTSTDCLGNLVTSGIVNLAMLSGTDTTSLVSGTSGTNPVGGFGAATVSCAEWAVRLPGIAVHLLAEGINPRFRGGGPGVFAYPDEPACR